MVTIIGVIMLPVNNLWLPGQLAFRPISFTPWPVDESFEGERVRIAVGKVNETELR